MRTIRSLFLIIGLVLIGAFTLNGAKISGELKKWHKVTIQFEGPEWDSIDDAVATCVRKFVALRKILNRLDEGVERNVLVQITQKCLKHRERHTDLAIEFEIRDRREPCDRRGPRGEARRRG